MVWKGEDVEETVGKHKEKWPKGRGDSLSSIWVIQQVESVWLLLAKIGENSKGRQQERWFVAGQYLK